MQIVRPTDVKMVVKDGKEMLVLKTAEEMKAAKPKLENKTETKIDVEPKGKKMAKKATKRDYSEIPSYARSYIYELESAGKLSIFNSGGEDEGITAATFYVDQKRKRMSQEARECEAEETERTLKEIGFEDVCNFFEVGEPDGLAMADIVIEYDFRKKPYTITNAKPKEMETLHDLLQYADLKKFRISRVVADKKGEYEDNVSIAEFKQAIANYLKQRQM